MSDHFVGNAVAITVAGLSVDGGAIPRRALD
jgi:hypothetical protein